ncbi:MAG: sugar-binding protein [Candidatus Methanofastidiosia archaeon]
MSRPIEHSVVIVAALLLSMCFSIRGLKAETNEHRIIHAVRAKIAPVIDGKLEDNCWRQAQEVTGFMFRNSNHLASFQSFGYVCYDESHIFIGVKCLIPQGCKPAGKMLPHDSNIWSHDIVEIMLDPGWTRSDYYQFAINAYGATFDCSRLYAGTHEDDAWNGEWEGKSYISDSFWSAELAIPFHNLSISPKVGSTWGINLCRETAKPTRELSSIALSGAFNDAKKFAILKGLNVNFRKYLFGIGPGQVVFDHFSKKPQGILKMPLINMTGKSRKVKVDFYQRGMTEKDEISSKEIFLKKNESIEFKLEKLDIEPINQKEKDLYIVRGRAKTKKIVVSDIKTGTILSVHLLKKPSVCEAMRLDVYNPWQKKISKGKTDKVSLKVHIFLPEEHLKKGKLLVNLISREEPKSVAATKSVFAPTMVTEIDFPTTTIPWGAYDVYAIFNDPTGCEIVSSKKDVVVLPGGKQSIHVLNNLVSELMNAKKRGLLCSSEIEFMNPRKGWCFFSITGNAKVKLDSEKNLLVHSKTGKEITEVMRFLPVGKHTVHINGELEELTIQAIPELIYCRYDKSKTHIKPFGPYDWPFLNKEVLSNCNLIIGNKFNEEMQKWRAQGKKWLDPIGIPGRGNKNISSEAFYQYWTKSLGYNHPQMNGIIVDEFIGLSEEKYIAFADSFRCLAADPVFKGRDLYAYCTSIFGSEAGKLFLHTLYGAGWHHALEQYLPEKPTEKRAKEFINDTLVRNAQDWNLAFPNSVRKAVITLGYLSQPTESLNIYPSVNYKVYMDMQFEAIANNPAFFGTYGIMEYKSAYSDEEIVRWAGRLYRHYCIEGNRTRLSKDPYNLTHILNPDFDMGTKHWEIKAAEKGSITVKQYRGYSWLQGRYPRTTQGDNFLVMRRSVKSPNVFSQEIKNLKPGHLYSMKMITADYQDLIKGLSKKAKHSIITKIDNVEILSGPKKSFQFIFPNGHALGEFNRRHKHYYWMNYHWYVFRAKGTTAKLRISDWKNNKEPGAPVGQELMFNFIEIQPYIGN